MLTQTYAPSPTSIVRTGADLWQQGVLGPDLAVSLRRAGLGLAIGLTVGVLAGVLGGLLRSGEYVFNGLVQDPAGGPHLPAAWIISFQHGGMIGYRSTECGRARRFGSGIVEP